MDPFQVLIADLAQDLLRVNCRKLLLTAVILRQVFHISLGLPGACLPSTCISHAVLTAPQELSTCPNQQSLLSLRMRSRSSNSNFASSSLDLTVATSSALILQICLIMALSLRCKCCRFILVNGQVSLEWSMVLCMQELYTWPRGLVREGGGM